MKLAVLASLTLLSLAGAGHAAPARAPLEPQASIPFVNHRGIRDWSATDARTLYVQDNRRRWYRAALFAPCLDLPHVWTIGFETRGVDTFDRFSSIRVGRDRCQISSLTPSDAPPSKAHRVKSS